MGGRGLSQAANLRSSHVVIRKGRFAEEQGVEGSSSHASASRGFHAGLASDNAILAAGRLGFRQCPDEGQAASECQHAG